MIKLSFLYRFESGSSEYFLNVNSNLIWRLIYIVSDSMCILNINVLIEIHLILYANDKYDKAIKATVHGHIVLVRNLLFGNFLKLFKP